MKRYKLFLLVCITALSISCSEEYDSVFDKSPDERANELVNKYKSVLIGSEHGWLFHYYSKPNELGGYSFLMKFNDQGVVTMNWGIRDEMQEAQYSCKMIDKPVLVFDTYCNFSKLADPNPPYMGGENELCFIGMSVAGDTLYMEERVSKEPVTFMRASATAWEDIKKYPMQARLIERRDEKVVPFYYNLVVEGWSSPMTMTYYDNRQVANLIYNEGGEDKFVTIGINFTHEGFEFHHPVEQNGIKVRSFRYDEASNNHIATDAGVKGRFIYQTTCAAKVPGMAERFFGAGKFGTNSVYASPKFMSKFEGLNPSAKVIGISYSAYGSSFSDLSISFDNWTTIRTATPTFTPVGTNTIIFGNNGNYTSYDYTDEEIVQIMTSDTGKEFENILLSENGWTIVPFYLLNEFSKSFYLVSNDDPEIYLCFGGDVD